MGQLWRCYWQPFAAASEMAERSTMQVRLLGEDLVAVKDRNGNIRLAGYPVEETAGLLWAYLGPLPAPRITPIQGFVVDGAIRTIGKAVVPCNWLQIMENSVDPVHAEWAHGKLYEFVMERDGVKVPMADRHVKIRFKEFPYGIYKQRLLEGQSEDCDDWNVGHPLIFPNMVATGSHAPSATNYSYQIRVPIDDENTLHLWYNALVPPAGAVVPPHLFAQTFVYDVPYRDAKGEFTLEMVDSQDIMCWVTAGPIADRSLEQLGTTDVGIIAFRKMLWRELERVERGEDPLGVVRDPGLRMVELPLERDKRHYSDGFAKHVSRTRLRFSPIADELIAVFRGPQHEQVA